MIKIGVDAMGGDNAPHSIVEGCVLAAKELPAGSLIVLIGQEKIINQELAKAKYTGNNIEIVNADEVIEMAEHPTKAFSQKPNSSISVGFRLLKEKQIDLFASAGNTGAMHVGALFTVKAIEGVQRPAIAGYIPQVNGGHAVMLDVGANADCKPDMLEQFAELGSIVAQYTFGIKKPRVALLNIGEEEKKGSLVTQAAHQLMKENSSINFIGNVEGYDLLMNKADVIVCDGFAGNLVFKFAESFYEISKERNIQDPFFQSLNYELVGGSPIVGINGNVMIAHGRSSALAIKNMIPWAIKQVQAQVHVHIAKSLA